MNKKAKRSEQLESIKKKLAAATAMLMVASTMMVSSTYAWFTLSTAPEVTGISTTVGANGNLEIALANTAGNATTVTSAAGDSMATKSKLEANLTWGNLVDLADASYGLENVVLLPAELNASSDKVQINNPLKYPEYGADGRVDTLNSNTSIATYDKTNAKWLTVENTYGVKAVGTVSGQSETVVAFREARSMLSQKASDAKNAASSALVANGETLGNIIIKKALEETDGAATFDATEVAAMQSMVNGLETSINHIGEALKYVALGRAASGEYTDTVLYEAVKKEVITNGSDLETVLKVFFGTVADGKVTAATEIPSADVHDGVLIAAYTKYLDTKSDIATAKSSIDTLVAKNQTSYTWTEISGPLSGLVDYNEVKVNDMGVDEVKANISNLVNNVLANGVKVKMPTGSGVIADIADLAGDYSASIKLKNVKYGTIEVAELPATMTTASTVDPDHLTNNSTYILNKGALSTGTSTGSNATFTDTYGYVVDLFFRTNVAGSDLLLQTEAVDRIYSDSTEGATMGSGSTMVFTSGNTTVFSETQMRSLMECIRLVFMEKDGTVIAHGKLEVSGANESTTEGTATLTGKVRLFDRTETTDETTGNKTVTETLRTDDTNTDEREDVKLTSLTQNEGKMVSVLVYLDGNKVDNTMVANASTSMTGSLNLQFASSATLVPMENNQVRDLAEEDAADGEETTVEYTITTAALNTTYSALSGATVTTNPVSKATAGTEVEVTADASVTVDSVGTYVLTSIGYGDSETNVTTITANSEGKYVFTMPEKNVKVVAMYDLQVG